MKFILYCFCIIFTCKIALAEPLFKLPTLDQKTFRSSDDFKGTKTVLIFTENSCIACMREISTLNSLIKTFSSEWRFVIISLNNAKDTRSFLSKMSELDKAEVLILEQSRSRVLTKFQNSGEVLPFNVFLTEDVQVCKTKFGAINEMDFINIKNGGCKTGES
jgi:hypothetical protein